MRIYFARLRHFNLAISAVLMLTITLPVTLISLSTQAETAAAKPEETVTLALDDADVLDLIRWAQDVTEKTIIIHPNVKGKVTVIAGEPMTRDEAYQVFLATLQVHGFATVESDTTLKILPDVMAKQNSVPIVDGDSSAATEDVVVRIVKVKNISATQLAGLLSPLVPQVAHLAAYPETNSLIIADRVNNITKVLDIIARLDNVGIVDIELVPLEFASAKEVMEVLNKLLSTQNHATEGGGELKLAVDERSNSLLLTGDPASRHQIRTLAQRLDQPLSGEGNTQVFHLNYAHATDLVDVLNSVSGSEQKNGKDQGAANIDVNITANKEQNALIVTAPPALLNTIKGVISKLDVRRPQVLVEALIVEVNEDLGQDLGIEFGSNSTGDIRGGFSNFPNQSSRPDVPPNLSLNAGLTLGYFRGGELRALINTLATESNANILSTPTIMALDNEEAQILVGQNVPFITGSQSREVGDPFQTIERQDVGITLKIKPRINRDNSVTLDIEQSVESVSESAEASDIVTNKRQIKTRVLIENNETLVLGGLIRDEIEGVERKVPLLGDIPVLGWLFKSTSTKTVKRNLMVFIHPTILENAENGRDLTQKYYSDMQDRQRNFHNKIETYFVPKSLPSLPDLKPSDAAANVKPETSPTISENAKP